MIDMNNVGHKVYVNELGEEGRIVGAKKNWLGRIVYFVDTETFKNVACYDHEMDFI
jgi:hypothetical protein